MSADFVIVDANIAFKCLHAGRGDLRERIRPGENPKFFSPRFLFVGLFKHKVALTLHMDGRLWTEDHELKTALQARGFDRFFEPQPVPPGE